MAFPKICFYSGDTNVDKVVYLRRFEWQCYQGNRMDSVSYNDYCRNMSYLCKDIDILKLLNGEEDYIREQQKKSGGIDMYLEESIERINSKLAVLKGKQNIAVWGGWRKYGQVETILRGFESRRI